MNDFTKNELKDILSWADVYTQFGTSWTTKIHLPLIQKIEKMLEGCDHHYVDEGIGSYCIKCKKALK